jgi:ketosteroid isomerase-like protein
MNGDAAGEVRAAANALISAFGAHRTEDYFRAFRPDASFVFYSSAERFESRAAYRAEWERWEREDGFRVLACTSSDQTVQVVGDTAVFTHNLITRIGLTAGEETVRERETIVFAREQGGSWLAVHEHLSPDPGPAVE